VLSVSGELVSAMMDNSMLRVPETFTYSEAEKKFLALKPYGYVEHAKLSKQQQNEFIEYLHYRLIKEIRQSSTPQEFADLLSLYTKLKMKEYLEAIAKAEHGL
jgi:hypothetical protein